jgi:hypothetical protein
MSQDEIPAAVEPDYALPPLVVTRRVEQRWVPAYPWAWIERSLDWVCQRCGHPGACWIAYRNPLARWVAQRAMRADGWTAPRP